MGRKDDCPLRFRRTRFPSFRFVRVAFSLRPPTEFTRRIRPQAEFRVASLRIGDTPIVNLANCQQAAPKHLTLGSSTMESHKVTAILLRAASFPFVRRYARVRLKLARFESFENSLAIQTSTMFSAFVMFSHPCLLFIYIYRVDRSVRIPREERSRLRM